MENSTTPATPQEARDALVKLCMDVQTLTHALDIAEARWPPFPPVERDGQWGILANNLRFAIAELIEAQVDVMRRLREAMPA